MSRYWGRRTGGTRIPTSRPLAWLTVTVALTACAIALFVLAENSAIAKFLPDWADKTASRRDVQVLVIGAITLLAIGGLRQFLYARLQRKPGPIEVSVAPSVKKSESSNGGGSSASIDEDAVLAAFRQTLAAISLSTPQAVPNSPIPESLLDDVKTASEKSGNTLATAAALARAAFRIRHAYRASIQLESRKGPQPCGVTVHVDSLPGGGDIGTFWTESWSEAAEKGAYFVGAFVLPRSRLANRPPWNGWRGQYLPVDLFEFSQRARQCVRSREYEKALMFFHRALKIDPQNPYLRIELGQVQEQLGLWLDATVTYADAVAIESWYDRGVWLRLRRLLGDNTSGAPPSRLRVSPHGRDAILLARYRLVGRLAAADELASQWELALSRVVTRGRRKEDTRQDRRATDRRALSERLSVWMGSYARRYAREFGVDPDYERYSRPQLRHFIQFVAFCETDYLVDDYRWSSGRRVPGMPVTQTALNVLGVWAPLYLQWASFTRPRERDEDCVEQWPPDAVVLEKEISRVLRRKLRPFREWQEHYNAACTFAVALRDADASTYEARRLTLRAIRHLERAVSRTDSGYLGAYAQWLSTGDQDLTPLRSTYYFVDFLDRYFPNDQFRVPRPEKLFRLIHSHHALRLLENFAAARAGYWKKAWVEGGPVGETVEVELAREKGAMDLVRDFCREFTDWRTRYELIEFATSFSKKQALQEFSSSLPQFQDDPSVPKAPGEAPGFSELVAEQHRSIQAYYNRVVRYRNRSWTKILAIVDRELESRASVGEATSNPYIRWNLISEMICEILADEVPETSEINRSNA
jgi:tetratricopeptide (TPR) repeat protein